MFNINKKNVNKEEELIVNAYKDLIAFGKLFLWGDFMKSETPIHHYVICDELLRQSNKPCAIILPRGAGKTTLVRAKIIHDFCFAKKAYEWGLANEIQNYYHGWCSSSQKKSRNNVSYIKLHLRHNERINYYFGKDGFEGLKGGTWNEEDIITAYGDRLASSSNLTSMRGDTQATIVEGALRYSCVFVDDAENEENTRTQNSREKIVDNVMKGILPAIEKNKPGCRLFLIGTPVHYDSFIQNILDKWKQIEKGGLDVKEDFSWKVITYKSTQPKMPGGVLWHSWYPRERLDEIKKTYEESPQGVGGYYQEYELEVQSAENALWTRKHIKYHDAVYMYDDNQNWLIINGEKFPVNVFIGCDPATDIDTKYSDYSVIMAVAVDSRNNAYVLEYERHRSIPTVAAREGGDIIDRMGVVDYIFKLYDKYHAVSATVEDVAMTRSVMQALNERKRVLNRYDLAVVPEKPAGRNKINKIYSYLSGRFGRGGVYLRENMFDLINEIITFGAKMSHDDTIETLFFALVRAYPPDLVQKPGKDTWESGYDSKKKKKSWITL